MRKRNFINCFFYYFAIITLPLLMVFLFFLFFVIQEKKQEIQSNAKRSAQAAKDNYSLVMDTAATQYDILARNPRLSICLLYTSNVPDPLNAAKALLEGR